MGICLIKQVTQEFLPPGLNPVYNNPILSLVNRLNFVKLPTTQGYLTTLQGKHSRTPDALPPIPHYYKIIPYNLFTFTHTYSFVFDKLLFGGVHGIGLWIL